MHSKMVTCCKEKSVLVAVYVEKPRRSLGRKCISKKSNSNDLRHHHHHRLHQIKRGSNRKAELLNYSQRLRESARSGASSDPLHHPKPAAAVSTHNQPQPMAQIGPFRSKSKHRTAPICMDWKLMFPKLFKSIAVFQAKRKGKNMKKKSSESASTKAKAIMKSFKGPKKGGFLSKVLATIQKYR